MPPSDPDHPTPPDEIPTHIATALQSQSAHRLATIAEYATELAAAKRSTDNDEEDNVDADAPEEQDDVETPDGVPARATKTKKTINNNQYWYWQWRDGDQIKSEYIAPVNPN